MFRFFIFSCIIGFAELISVQSCAQVMLYADGPGNTYELINSVLAPGYTAMETPDMTNGSHAAFGRHIAEVYDSTLKRNVFEFYIHALIDNDISTLETDRQRVEIKTYSSSPKNLRGDTGETMTLKWKFKLPTGFKPSSAFTHIHQLKAVDGDDSSPLFTLTARKGSSGSTDQLQMIYVADSSTSSKVLDTINLSLLLNTWIEVTEVIKVGANGNYSITINKLSDGSVLKTFTKNNIKTIRPSNSFVRPKWGIYRSLNDVGNLRDDSIRFADFSIEEVCNCN